ncbi:MAG: hypothetical protein AAGH46_03760 [Bacteroidota bacterium]
MIIIAKLILGSFLIILSVSELPFSKKLSNNYETVNKSEDPARAKAFEVLTNKCNVCHTRRNKRRVFTTENMDAFAQDVYKQVFVKKRMPKGKNIKLTSQDYQDLLTWISATKN